ncbi:hypothetical protein FQA39_LY05323 [Lamprigera yunnana]|nr:hypothetical protein FQA39_LY05323 [Lamprigera yunnana]
MLESQTTGLPTEAGGDSEEEEEEYRMSVGVVVEKRSFCKVLCPENLRQQINGFRVNDSYLLAIHQRKQKKARVIMRVPCIKNEPVIFKNLYTTRTELDLRDRGKASAVDYRI